MDAKTKNMFCPSYQSRGLDTASARVMLDRRTRPRAPGALRMTRILFLLGLVFVLAGCGPEDFLNPLYTKNDLITDPLLPGTWEQKAEDATLILQFLPAKGSCYTLKYTVLPADPEDTEGPYRMKFDARLVQLGRAVFLDLQSTTIPIQATTETFHLSFHPSSSNETSISPFSFHLQGGDDDGFPAGLFVTLAPVRGSESTDTRPECELRLTPAHWIFRIWIDQTTLRLSDFEPSGDVATLSSKDLQRLALKYADDRDVFSSVGEWKRRNGGSR